MLNFAAQRQIFSIVSLDIHTYEDIQTLRWNPNADPKGREIYRGVFLINSLKIKMKHSAITVFQYDQSDIAFKSSDGSVMVNATQMAKPFGKFTKDWLVSKSAMEFIDELSVVRGVPPTGLVVVHQGGRNQGTWMHEDVAIEFARWLSPKFAIWCNDRIKELLRKGYTSVVNNPIHRDSNKSANCRHRILTRTERCTI